MLQSPNQDADKQRVVQRLLEGLRGFEVVEASPPPELGIDVRLRERRTGRSVAAEVKLLPARRAGEIPAALAMASYQLRSCAGSVNAEALAVFWLPQWNPAVVAQVRAFSSKFDLKLGWAILSEDGGFAVSLPAFQLERSHEPRSLGVHVPRLRQSVDLLTDANRWMLKLLLLLRVEQRFWAGPRDPIAGVLALSRAAGVTPESAYRFARSLQAHGLARLERGTFQLLDTQRLMNLWLSVDTNKPLLWQPVRWTRGKADDIGEVFGQGLPGQRYAVTNYEGCRRLGLLHAAVAGIDVQVEGELEQAMRHWKLEPVAPHEGHFRLARARFPRSVFGGAVEAGGVWVVDALQIALDVRSHPARGVEQSDYILERLQVAK